MNSWGNATVSSADFHGILAPYRPSWIFAQYDDTRRRKCCIMLHERQASLSAAAGESWQVHREACRIRELCRSPARTSRRISFSNTCRRSKSLPMADRKAFTLTPS